MVVHWRTWSLNLLFIVILLGAHSYAYSIGSNSEATSEITTVRDEFNSF